MRRRSGPKLGKSGNLAFVNRRRINNGAPGGKRLSDFVALLIAVAAFLVTMMVGQGLIVALHGALNYNDSVIAFGPVLRLAAALQPNWSRCGGTGQVAPAGLA
jgi:hypothetical protein